MNQYANAIEVLTAVAGTMTDPNKLLFYTNIKTAVNSNNPSLTHFTDYGKTLAQVQTVLPARETINATAWELSVPGVCRQIACFIEESNELEAPLAGNTAGTSHKDLIMAEIDVRIDALD